MQWVWQCGVTFGQLAIQSVLLLLCLDSQLDHRQNTAGSPRCDIAASCSPRCGACKYPNALMCEGHRLLLLT